MTGEKGFDDFGDEIHAGDAYDFREALEAGVAGVAGVGAAGAAGEDARLRALLAQAAPEFPVTVALGDRALAGAARRRARVRGLGGLGVVALVAVGAVAVAPLAGWGGRGSGAAAERVVAGAVTPASALTTSTTSATSETSTGAPTLSPPLSPPPSASGEPPPGKALSSNVVSVSEAKVQAQTRVMNALRLDHQNSYMGVIIPQGQSDASPIVVYRKPVSDPTLASEAAQAAAPYTVVFRDSVLDASEQWFLGHRLQQDLSYWKGQGVLYATALQEDGTITVYTPDPARVVPLLEQHYGYDGRVFVGWEQGFAPPGVNSTGG